jgi:hypothetical protein
MAVHTPFSFLYRQRGRHYYGSTEFVPISN